MRFRSTCQPNWFGNSSCGEDAALENQEQNWYSLRRYRGFASISEELKPKVDAAIVVQQLVGVIRAVRYG